MNLHTSKFAIAIKVEPFAALNPISVDGALQYKISDIADLKGRFSLSLYDEIVENDSPVLNFIEVSEFLYGLAVESAGPVPLTIDMEGIMYGWRERSKITITSFKSKEMQFHGEKNILGYLTGTELAESLLETIRSAHEIAKWDPYLYCYLLGRMYRRSVEHIS